MEYGCKRICTLIYLKNGNYNYSVIKQADAMTGDYLKSSAP